jgi:hypothetical protein
MTIGYPMVCFIYNWCADGGREVSAVHWKRYSHSVVQLCNYCWNWPQYTVWIYRIDEWNSECRPVKMRKRDNCPQGNCSLDNLRTTAPEDNCPPLPVVYPPRGGNCPRSQIGKMNPGTEISLVLQISLSISLTADLSEGSQCMHAFCDMAWPGPKQTNAHCQAQPK